MGGHLPTSAPTVTGRSPVRGPYCRIASRTLRHVLAQRAARRNGRATLGFQHRISVARALALINIEGRIPIVQTRLSKEDALLGGGDESASHEDISMASRNDCHAAQWEQAVLSRRFRLNGMACFDGPVLVRTTYLEQRSAAAVRAAREPVDPVDIVRVEVPSPEFCRFLYVTVGGDWYWYDRLGWSREVWLSHLSAPMTETWVAWVRGAPAGYAELAGVSTTDRT